VVTFANPLAYYDETKVIAVKSVIVQAPGVTLILLLSIFSHSFSKVSHFVKVNIQPNSSEMF
jgi:hypothetical protein